nr:pectate lyase [Bacteroidaceae bacterium]
PSDRVKAAIEGAIQWMKDHAIVDMVLETYVNDEGKPDKRLVHKVGAPLLWARYYDLENEEPMFCDRDGIPKKHIEDIGYERRNGYSWLGDSPKKIINIKVK